MLDAASRFKVQKFVSEVMILMETENLSIAESEVVPDMLRISIKENSERIEKSKPFTVYKSPANPLDNS